MPRLILFAFLVTASAHAAVVPVSTADELKAAISAAQPGDEIVLADGTYDFNASVAAWADGAVAQPITVRAQNRLGAKIRFNTLEGFKVTGAHWVFDGLDVQGTCAQDSDCEHAFHVTGRAERFVLRNSRVLDFNAQLKVNATQNGSTWDIPHNGLIERNEIADTHPRATSNPVTKLNIDTGDLWIVRDNVIRDFHKDGGNFISYGAFMKSGGNNGVFERNLVLCTRDVATGGTRIGLSFGGGGTANQFCAPAFDAAVPCDPEHSSGVMRNNVIVNCSDVGIYLNKASDTRVLFNTLIATTGVDFRFPSTTGEAHGNVLAQVIRGRNGGTFTAGTNLEQVSDTTFSGWYQAPLQGDLTVVGDVSALIAKAAAHSDVADDFCARPRPGTGLLTLGAVEHSLGECAAPGDAGVPDDAGMTFEDAGADVPDAGQASTDGGTAEEDGGTPDADGGVGQPVTSGCGCGAGAFAPALALGVLPLLLFRRRKRDAGVE